MNAISARKTHYHEIDILYAFGTILAVLGHSHPNDWSTFPGQWVEFIYLFHMPLFFAIAGFLLAASQSIKSLDYGKWLQEKAFRLLTPYFVLSLIALVPKYVLEHNGFTGFTPLELITEFLAPRNNVWGHFWFLPVLFIMYAVFGAMHRLRTANPARNLSWLWLALFFLTLILHFIKSDILWLGISDLCDFSVYFMLGYAVFQFNIPQKKVSHAFDYALYAVLSPIIVLLLWCFAPKNDVLDFLIAVLMLVCLYSVSCLTKGRRTPALDFVTQYVFTFYIYSWPAQAVMERVCSHFLFPWSLTVPIMFVIGMLCPAMIVLLYRKCTFLHCRFVDLVLGMRR